MKKTITLTAILLSSLICLSQNKVSIQNNPTCILLSGYGGNPCLYKGDITSIDTSQSNIVFYFRDGSNISIAYKKIITPSSTSIVNSRNILRGFWSNAYPITNSSLPDTITKKISYLNIYNAQVDSNGFIKIIP